MTDEDRAAANAQMSALVRWLNDECAKMCSKLDSEQGDQRKFDGGNAPYRELHEEFARRMKEIGQEHGLIKEDA